MSHDPDRAALSLGHPNRLLAAASLLAHKTLVAGVSVLLVSLALVGCSLPTRNASAGSVRLDSSCADKVISALTSTTVVPGAYACLDAAKQSRLAGSGIANDVDMASIASPATVMVCGPMKPADATHNQIYYYVTPTTVGTSTPVVLQFVTDRTDGKVAYIFITTLTKCP